MGYLVVGAGVSNGTVTPANQYLGQVATGCQIPTNKTSASANQQFNSRSRHRAMQPITSLQIALANWNVDPSTKLEVASGAIATVTASIEYPVGTFTQIKFSAIASGTAASGATLISDALAITIPRFAVFYVRVWWNASVANAIPYITSPALSTARGEAFEYGVTVTDKTMGGSLVDAGAGLMFRPVAIIAATTAPSIALLGDSRVKGLTDNYTADATDDMGEFGRPIGAGLAYINFGQSGERLTQFISSHDRRLALAAYCSHIIIQYAYNDLVAGRSDAQIIADKQTILGYFTGKRCYTCTVPPGSTSTDAWATTVNQTTVASNAVRVTHNASVRAGIAGFTGYFEIADQVESARDSGLWKVTGYTTDGIHETAFANQKIRDSGAVDIGTFQF